MKKVFKFLALLIVLLVIAFFVLQKKSIPLEILKKKYTTADSKFMELDGMQVHYRMEGNGTPIVLIHGTGSALQTWDGWMDSLLAHQFNVIRLDMPAFGLTGPRSDKDYSTKMYVDFLDRFLQQLGIDTFALAGNSLGGEIAWKYALAHPSKVSNLILVVVVRSLSEKQSSNRCFIFEISR